MNFIEETIKRFLSKNPSYFKIINIILGIAIFITGVPLILQQYSIELNGWVALFASKTVLVASIVGRILTQLTTTQKSITDKDS